MKPILCRQLCLGKGEKTSVGVMAQYAGLTVWRSREITCDIFHHHLPLPFIPRVATTPTPFSPSQAPLSITRLFFVSPLWPLLAHHHMHRLTQPFSSQPFATTPTHNIASSHTFATGPTPHPRTPFIYHTPYALLFHYSIRSAHPHIVTHLCPRPSLLQSTPTFSSLFFHHSDSSLSLPLLLGPLLIPSLTPSFALLSLHVSSPLFFPYSFYLLPHVILF